MATNGISRTTRQSLLNHLFLNTSFAAPTHTWVALFTASPSATGGGTEVTGGAYVRVECTTWSTASAAEPSVITNGGDITFATATTTWGSVVAFGIFSASTSGTMYAYGAATKTIGTGDTAKFLSGQLSVSLTESSS